MLEARSVADNFLLGGAVLGDEGVAVKPLRNLFPFVRVGFIQNGFSWIFFSNGRFLHGSCRRFFSLHLCGKKCPEKSSRKIPGKSSSIYTTEIPDTFLQRGQANFCSGISSQNLDCKCRRFSGNPLLQKNSPQCGCREKKENPRDLEGSKNERLLLVQEVQRSTRRPRRLAAKSGRGRVCSELCGRSSQRRP